MAVCTVELKQFESRGDTAAALRRCVTDAIPPFTNAHLHQSLVSSSANRHHTRQAQCAWFQPLTGEPSNSGAAAPHERHLVCRSRVPAETCALRVQVKHDSCPTESGIRINTQRAVGVVPPEHGLVSNLCTCNCCMSELTRDVALLWEYDCSATQTPDLTRAATGGANANGSQASCLMQTHADTCRRAPCLFGVYRTSA